MKKCLSTFFDLILSTFKSTPVRMIFKKAAHFIVYSNLFVAFCALAMAFFSFEILQFGFDSHLLAFIFSSTLFAYNFQRRLSLLYEQKNLNSEQNRWILRNKGLSNAITVFSLLACFYLLYRLPHDTLLLIAPLAMISLLYVLRIGNQPALRSIPFLKVFIVAFVWGGSMILLPTLFFEGSFLALFSLKNQSLSLALSLFVFGQSLPFDIRDMGDDEAAKLRTIPAKIGIQKTIWTCWLGFGLSASIMCFSYFSNFISFRAFSAFLISIALTAAVIYLTKKLKHHLFYGLLLEGCLCLPLLVYWGLESST